MGDKVNDEKDAFQPIGKVAAKLVNVLGQANKFPVLLLSDAGEHSGGLCLSVKGAETFIPVANSNFSTPASAPAPINPLQSRRGPSLAVAGVLLKGSCAQVRNAVVGSDPVDMVNNFTRPLASDVKPGEAMGEIGDTIGANYPITKAESASPPPAKSGIGQISPDKFSGIRRIVQEFAESFMRDKVIATDTHLSDPKTPKDEVERTDEQSDERADKPCDEVERADIERRMRDILAMENRLRRNKI